MEQKTPPPPNNSQEMRIFLEVEGKMGPIPQSTSSQYRPPQLDTTPNVRKDKAAEKGKRVVSTKRFRANTVSKPSEAAAWPPTTISNAPTNIKPQAQEGTDNRPPPLEDAPVCESTSWTDAGKISGNLFEERKDWLLPPNYLNNDNKDTAGVTSPKPPMKEEPKIEEQSFTSLRTDKCGWGPNCPFCKNQEKEDNWDGNHQKQLQQQKPPQQEIQMPLASCPQTLSYQRPQNFQKFKQETSDG